MRTFNGIDLDKLEYRKLDGIGKVPPKGEDLSGIWYEEEADQGDKDDDKAAS